jgi:hypothetical protein
MSESTDAGNSEERTAPFRLIQGGRGLVVARSHRRWKRPARRQSAQASIRRMFRWGRGRPVLPKPRLARWVKTGSWRVRTKRRRGPRWRTLDREAVDTLRRTQSEADFLELAAKCWQQVFELAAELRPLAFDPNG